LCAAYVQLGVQLVCSLCADCVQLVCSLCADCVQLVCSLCAAWCEASVSKHSVGHWCVQQFGAKSLRGSIKQRPDNAPC
jgi:hypothetical protein